MFLQTVTAFFLTTKSASLHVLALKSSVVPVCRDVRLSSDKHLWKWLNLSKLLYHLVVTSV